MIINSYQNKSHLTRSTPEAMLLTGLFIDLIDNFDITNIICILGTEK